MPPLFMNLSEKGIEQSAHPEWRRKALYRVSAIALCDGGKDMSEKHLLLITDLH